MTSDVLRQLDAVLKNYLEENRRNKIQTLFPTTILIPEKFFREGFGSAESVFVCLSSGAIEVRPTSHDGVYFE